MSEQRQFYGMTAGSSVYFFVDDNGNVTIKAGGVERFMMAASFKDMMRKYELARYEVEGWSQFVSDMLSNAASHDQLDDLMRFLDNKSGRGPYFAHTFDDVWEVMINNVSGGVVVIQLSNLDMGIYKTFIRWPKDGTWNEV
jgi:hypothetical protein